MDPCAVEVVFGIRCSQPPVHLLICQAIQGWNNLYGEQESYHSRQVWNTPAEINLQPDYCSEDSEKTNKYLFP